MVICLCRIILRSYLNLMKKYSAAERPLIAQAQLYTLDKQFQSDIDGIQSLSDFLPGVVLVNNVLANRNVYMNKVGCNFLRREKEELYQMGLQYFGATFFHVPEMQWIAQTFRALVQQKEESKTVCFYQKVRSNHQTPWIYYHLSGKLMENNPGCCIYMGTPSTQDNYMLNRINKVIDVEVPDTVMYARFSSLTKREKEILSLVSKGCTSKQISDILFLSTLTVEVHRKNLRKKLESRSLSDMITFARYFDL